MYSYIWENEPLRHANMLQGINRGDPIQVIAAHNVPSGYCFIVSRINGISILISYDEFLEGVSKRKYAYSGNSA